MVSVSLLILHLSVLAISIVGDNSLSCESHGCVCRGRYSDILHCNITDDDFYVPNSISTDIRHLEIYGANYSVRIPDQDYDDSWSVLETLEIYGNGGSRQHLNLPQELTNKLTPLKLLRIRDAGLISISRKAFSNLTALEELGLSKNEFLNMDEIVHAFNEYGATKLQTLNVSRVHSSKEMRPFKGLIKWLLPLKSLLNVDISWTRTSLNDMYITIESRTSFINKYRDLINNFLPNLVTLDISGTRVYYEYLLEGYNCTYRVPFFVMFKKLEALRIDHLMINQHDSNYTGPAISCSHLNGCYRLPPNLKELHLNHASAKKFYIDFEKNVCISSKLEHMFLRNLIVSGPVGNIIGLHYLKSLDISYTRFPFSLQLFLDMPSVEKVDASGNYLYKVENETGFVDLLAKNVILKEISLSDNGFLELPDNLFRRNILLESIDISRNRLQYLKLNLTACSHLHQLSVAHNRLKMIDSSMTDHLDSLVSDTINNKKVKIIISDNDLTCSCEGSKLVRWIQKTSVVVDENSNFTCDFRERQEDMNDYNSTSFNCSNDMKTSSNVTIPESVTKAKKKKLSYILGGVLGSILCALCLFIIIMFLKWKYGSREVRELQEYSLQEHSVINDEYQEIVSSGDKPCIISKDEEPNLTSNDKELKRKVSNKENKKISVSDATYIFNDIDSACLISDSELQNTATAMSRRELLVSESVCVKENKHIGSNDAETCNSHGGVPDSVYFIGLTETPFESYNRKPHFAAFLAYSHNDKDFVVSKLYCMLQRHLEKYMPSWNKELLTVLYDKNFLPGQCTMDLTRAAVFSSYVTVAIVSDSFIKSSWCHYEMEAAIEAKVPIISVYLPGCDTDKFPAIMKYIYHNHVRIFWPDTADNLLEVSDEEASIVRNLAFSISTYLKH